MAKNAAWLECRDPDGEQVRQREGGGGAGEGLPATDGIGSLLTPGTWSPCRVFSGAEISDMLKTIMPATVFGSHL